ncbi:AsnC family transcriptional regulator [Salipiger pallidus]|uniref:AsnC family transcriptional regulator n=1 Tax=Salipiger pallidus TaxID=1775170 RepID=A0A8J3EEP5_9RHOB|nr:Lrp/AsnC family transcriptional regulator [Salipiger pallidus]GGG65279.1 AsnC family transcriptional regulator [Salipiger pallidus]
MPFDRIDLKILDLLQHDATMPVARIADRVGLSQTPCWKRIQKHEEAGTIRGRVALLDPDAFGLGVTAFVSLEAAEHSAAWRSAFLIAVDEIEAIRDVYRMAGSYDYLLRVVVPDMPAFDRFYEALTSAVTLRKVESVFALERLRDRTTLPLGELQ